MVVARNECGQSGHGTLKLAVYQEWVKEWTHFLHDGSNSGKRKVIPMIFGWA